MSGTLYELALGIFDHLLQYEISFKTVHDDFGRKIGKIRYHYFEN